MYVVYAIIAFGILIAGHELGHFTAAKLCKVKVNEFSIGMGPAILKKQGKETLYSLRVLPIGGYCAMEGEDENSEDKRAFTSQPAWKRLIILVAGSFMNFLIGLIIVIIIFSQSSFFAGNTVVSFLDGFALEGEDGLMAGDIILEIDGERIYYADDFSTFMARANGKAVDMTVSRSGEKITLNDFPLYLNEYEVDGQTVTKYGISFNSIEANSWEKLKYSFYSAYNFVRYVRLGLSDLVSGAVSLNDMSGPVGIVSTIQEVGETSASAYAALVNIAYLCAFITINLSVMNMLPIPALDGGRIFFLFVTWIVEKITRRRINPKYEGYVHAAGMVLLLGLMAVVMFNDIARIINGG